MILFDWCQEEGLKDIFGFIKNILQIVRIVVPIGLLVWTGMDIFKKVINPDDKDGQTKILHRVIAAVLVFFTPLMVRFVLKLVDIGGGNSNVSSCWESAR